MQQNKPEKEEINIQQPTAVLKKYWGYDAFRPLQEDIIQSVLDGRDTLALLPTGGGKSICFQIPSLCREGICIVVSPLIALMKDQVHNLQKRNISAVAIYSGMPYRDIDRILDNCIYGNIKFLYLSPERLMTELARERLKKMNINLLAIDEAHCISQWGYDFRPPYLQIPEIRNLLPNIPVLALTATATKTVVKDIQDKLEFNEGKVFQKSFARSNLAYVVLSEEDKLGKLLHILQKMKGTGIVYVRNRKRTKDIAYYLSKHNIAADFYHAGLSTDIRSQKQEDWINNKIRIIISTNAFGMGIDKPDVRIVVHMDLPDNLEAYFQEAGRGGRDGKKSYAVLLYNQSDKAQLEKNFAQSYPEIKEIKRTYEALGSYYQLALGSGEGQSFDFDIVAFTQNYKLNVFKTFSCLKILAQAGWIALSESVYVPSAIMIIVDKEQLYDYQLRNRNYEKIIKIILRSTQGAFNHFVAIRESQIAHFLKTSTQTLQTAFTTMQQEGILKYRPQKDEPQLTFLQERVDLPNLAIDRRLYNFRKERQLYRIQRAIAYAENNLCRSLQLLRYFGETDAKSCGVCDICLEVNKQQLSKEDFDRYQQKVRQLIKKEALSLEEIIQAFNSRTQAAIIKVVEYLIDENFIVAVDDKWKWKSE